MDAQEWHDDPPFIGRRGYLSELRRALFSAPEPRCISIYGMPRVGKSWLLKETTKNRPDKVIVIFPELSRSFYYIVRNFFLMPRKSWLGKLGAEERQELESMAKSAKPGTDSIVMMNIFHAMLRQTTRMGYRVILCLDEFDRIIDSPWREEEYNSLVGLLMDKELNVACVTASRRTVDSLLAHNGYRCRINPFESWLLTGFNKEDMEECLERLEAVGCPISNQKELDRLMYWCGRNPHLLVRTMLVPYVQGGGTASLEQIHKREETRRAFIKHFNEVLGFMDREEQLREHSFSHVVKCFFDPSPDYRDIQERFIGMGYLELLDPQSRFTWSGYRGKFVYRDTDRRYGNARFADELEPGGDRYVYIALSPWFIDRFYTADFPTQAGQKSRGTVLDQVKDAKDLLTSFVHTLRDMTAEEMQKASCADCQHRKRCPQCGRGEMAGIFGADWNEKLLHNCVKAKDKGRDVLFDASKDVRGIFDIQELKGGIRCIKLSSPATFLLSAFNRSGAERSVTPLLDPINLSSNGQLILSFAPRFQNYFGCFRDFSAVPGKEFEPALRHLEAARNEIAHFSRVGMTAVMTEDTAALCRYLLRSIYLWRREGEKASPAAPPVWRTK